MTDEQYAALAAEMERISARLKQINDELDEVEAKTSDNYEKLTSIGEGLEKVEALLVSHDDTDDLDDADGCGYVDAPYDSKNNIIQSALANWFSGDWQSGSMLEALQMADDYERLLFDIGIDPDAEYSTLDRSILRDRLAGTQVAGVMVS